MNKWVFFSILFLFITIMVGIIFKTNTTPAIKFFPIDNKTTFEQARTALDLHSTNDKPSYQVEWSSSSKSDKQVYLRQDISLLFVNGRLRGVRSKWVQDTDLLQFKEKLYGQEDSLWQSISFHHGEVHLQDDSIRSVHKMSHDTLYVFKTIHSGFDSFSAPHKESEIKMRGYIDKITKQHLLLHWNQLIEYFNIDNEKYNAIPLTNLHKYEKEKLGSFTEQQKKQIIGQLWEGLYKNYVVPAVGTEENKLISNVPLVLFDKNNTHLLVIYELNGKKEKLIQQFPNY